MEIRCAGGANGIGKEVALAFSKHGWVVQPTATSTILIILFSAKVVIGDLDVAGTEAVVATIAKNGGCVALTIQRGKCLTDPFLNSH